jgi:hypothetical protein
MDNNHDDGPPAKGAKRDELAPREVGMLAASTINALVTHSENAVKGACYAGAMGYLGELGGKEGVIGAVEPIQEAVERLRVQLRSVSDLNVIDWEAMLSSDSPLRGFLGGCIEYTTPAAFEQILGGMTAVENTDRLFLTSAVLDTFRAIWEPLDRMLHVFYEFDKALSFSSSDKGNFKDNLREALAAVVNACNTLSWKFTQPPWEIRMESRLAAWASFG